MTKSSVAPGTIFFERWVAAPTSHVRYKGVWDMQDLYQSMADWFKYKKYKFNELLEEHRQPTPFGQEGFNIWQAARKENDYTSVQYDIYFHYWDISEVEAVVAMGETKMFTKGRLWIEMRVVILYDYEKRWDNSIFFRHLKDFYNKYVIKKKSEYEYSPKFRTEIFELQAFIKNRLRMMADEYEHAYTGGVHVKT